ncbi:putative zinc metalloproteinase [[Candida] jaroonii]|uniref:Zinc metalloproteinase n=1 Tax=[Candida] jaroonii TaxID=467808 RepID=A0ACA9YDV6_9ASCO|nr:putative zinc metalloproteinase [[Candida] jaroonii]
MVQFNYQNNEIVSSPTVIVSGSSTISRGIVEFINNENQVFPPQSFEINNHQFKAIVHVSPDKNYFKVKAFEGIIDGYGFPQKGKEVDSGELSLLYYPLNNKPIHLCVILGRDSNGSYDMPKYRTARGEVANLDMAVKKLKVAGRLMQAYTQDEMRLSGLSNRTFQFVEETTDQQGIFGYNVKSPTPHQEVKVHVLRSPKTVAELRDPNLAQQNAKGTNTGGLFSHALDLIKNSPLYGARNQSGTCIQCAVIYLDAHYDVGQDLILTHAALGGGNGDIKLAIFGSHGLHSWPSNFPQTTSTFLDATHLSKREVANDANQCGTSWECLNITMGAFMHEIGHSLGSPHQVNGVMLRDYIWWNRSFMTRESECLRTSSRGGIIGPNGWPGNQVCHWNILDKFRYLHHGSFAIPTDNDTSHVYSTTFKRDNSYHGQNPASYVINDGSCVIKSGPGIFLIEVVTKDLTRYHIPYLPQNYGGPGLQHEVVLDYHHLYQCLGKDKDENYAVRVLSLAGDLYISNFKKHVTRDIIRSDFGLGLGDIDGYKSEILGRDNGDEKMIGFDLSKVSKVRVYHGGALDGVRFYSSAPPVPARNYMNKLVSKISSSDKMVGLGNEKPHYTDIDVDASNPIVKFHFRNGAWIDAIQVEFADGSKSAMLGNSSGGHLSTLEVPGAGYRIVGMYGYVGGWMNGVGIIYAAK